MYVHLNSSRFAAVVHEFILLLLQSEVYVHLNCFESRTTPLLQQQQAAVAGGEAAAAAAAVGAAAAVAAAICFV